MSDPDPIGIPEGGDPIPSLSGKFKFRTPASSGTAQQTRVRMQASKSSTEQLRRVSSQFMASEGREDVFDGGASVDFGEKQRSYKKARSPKAAAPNSVPHLKKFVRDEAVSDEDMLDIDVTLKKENYGVPGTSDYRKNMVMATTGLAEKFGVARHKIVGGSEEDGDQPKYAHVQQVRVSILHRVKEGVQRSQAMDFMDICTIPQVTAGDFGSKHPRD